MSDGKKGFFARHLDPGTIFESAAGTGRSHAGKPGTDGSTDPAASPCDSALASLTPPVQSAGGNEGAGEQSETDGTGSRTVGKRAFGLLGLFGIFGMLGMLEGHESLYGLYGLFGLFALFGLPSGPRERRPPDRDRR
jgi:hypothetical protein